MYMTFITANSMTFMTADSMTFTDNLLPTKDLRSMIILNRAILLTSVQVNVLSAEYI